MVGLIHPPLQFQSRFDNFKRLAEAGALPQHQVDWLVTMTSDLAAAVTQLSPHVVKRPCEWWATGAFVRHYLLRFPAKFFLTTHNGVLQRARRRTSPAR